MFILNEDGKSRQIVSRLVEYAESKGIRFKVDGLDDSSPYCSMKGGTSLSYRKFRRKWPDKGIVVFATDVDADNLQNKLGLQRYDNDKDSDRPNTIFIPKEKFEEAIEILASNPQNRD